MFLKQYDGDVTDLCLSFTTSRDIVGGAVSAVGCTDMSSLSGAHFFDPNLRAP